MSYEKNESKSRQEGKTLTPRMDISLFKFLWQTSFLAQDPNSIPRFLRDLKLMDLFSDSELKVLTNFFHLRTFSPSEVIFEQDDVGFGFYIIYKGHVDIMVRNIQSEEDKALSENPNQETLVQVARLEKGDYFGELALLQDSSIRTATTIAYDHTTLIGMFKPDMDELMENHPLIAVKMLKIISMILANRITNVTNEIKALKYKISLLENNVPEKKF